MMKALLKKDWLVSKSLLKSYVMVIVLYGLIAYFNDNVFLFTGFSMMIPIMMVINSTAYDERAHTERWMIASGISRKHLALSKYLFALMLILCTTLLNFYVIGIVEELMIAVFASLLFGLIGMTYVSLVLPAVFYFGSEKARIFMMAGFIVPFALGALITYVLQMLGLHLNEIVMIGLVVLLCFVIIFASMMLSVFILNKKDY